MAVKLTVAMHRPRGLRATQQEMTRAMYTCNQLATSVYILGCNEKLPLKHVLKLLVVVIRK
jgi:hypothetical protein